MPRLPLQPADVVLELGAELGVGDVVDEPGERPSVRRGHAAAHGAEVGMVIRAVEQVRDARLFGSHAEKSAHEKPPGKVDQDQMGFILRNRSTGSSGQSGIFLWRRPAPVLAWRKPGKFPMRSILLATALLMLCGCATTPEPGKPVNQETVKAAKPILENLRLTLDLRYPMGQTLSMQTRVSLVCGEKLVTARLEECNMTPGTNYVRFTTGGLVHPGTTCHVLVSPPDEPAQVFDIAIPDHPKKLGKWFDWQNPACQIVSPMPVQTLRTKPGARQDINRAAGALVRHPPSAHALEFTFGSESGIYFTVPVEHATTRGTRLRERMWKRTSKDVGLPTLKDFAQPHQRICQPGGGEFGNDAARQRGQFHHIETRDFPAL